MFKNYKAGYTVCLAVHPTLASWHQYNHHAAVKSINYLNLK